MVYDKYISLSTYGLNLSCIQVLSHIYIDSCMHYFHLKHFRDEDSISLKLESDVLMF